MEPQKGLLTTILLCALTLLAVAQNESRALRLRADYEIKNDSLVKFPIDICNIDIWFCRDDFVRPLVLPLKNRYSMDTIHIMTQTILNFSFEEGIAYIAVDTIYPLQISSEASKFNESQWWDWYQQEMLSRLQTIVRYYSPFENYVPRSRRVSFRFMFEIYGKDD